MKAKSEEVLSASEQTFWTLAHGVGLYRWAKARGIDLTRDDLKEVFPSKDPDRLLSCILKLETR